ncbi:MAG: hypothetical protein AAGE18_01570 [Pseudomonadota bacterium]
MTNYATFVVPLEPMEASELKTLHELARASLSIEVPGIVPVSRGYLPFNKLARLHFASLYILPPDPPFAACMVLEATFDGSRDGLIEVLLEECGKEIHALFRRGVGYPAPTAFNPALVRHYLRHHDAGAQLFYSGLGGRSVGQIRSEQCLRRKVRKEASAARDDLLNLPATFVGVYRRIARNLLVKPAWTWAHDLPPLPARVRHRGLFTGLALLLLLFVVAGLLHCLFGPLPIGVEAAQAWLWPADRPLLGAFRAIALLLTVGVLFAGLPIIQKRALARIEPPPGGPDGLIAWLRHTGAFAVRIGATLVSLVLFVAAAVLLLVSYAAALAPVGTASGIVFPGIAAPAGWGQAAIALVVVGIAIYAIGLLADAASRRGRLNDLSPAEKAFWWKMGWPLRAAQGVLLFALLALCLSAAGWTGIAGGLAAVFAWLAEAVLFLAWGGVALIAFIAVWFFAVSLEEIRERRDEDLMPPVALMKVPAPEAVQHEDIGPNSYQNNLVSITRLKGGRLRRYSLRLILSIIHVLAWVYFNQGALGGLSMILTGRWVMLDGGRRLLFSAHYLRPWDFYIDAFSESGNSRGVNAIWTHTAIRNPIPGGPSRVAFPPGRYVLWDGCTDRLPFKAYIRHSQVETLGWYSAYPTLSPQAIWANTAIRRAVFERGSSQEIAEGARHV